MGNCFEAWMELHWRSLFSGAKSKEVPALPGSQREEGFVYPRNSWNQILLARSRRDAEMLPRKLVFIHRRGNGFLEKTHPPSEKPQS